MTRLKLKGILTLLVTFFSLSVLSPAYASTAPVQILGINDFHGNLSKTNTANMPDGPVKNAGTAALLAGYLNQSSTTFMAANPTGVTFRVNSGDMVGASPADSALIYDQPTLAVLNAMNIQVGTLGNHEFDKGLSQFNTIFNGLNPLPGANPLADSFYSHYTQDQLKANYDLTIANLVDKTSGQIPFGWQPYVIKTVTNSDGQTVKIGYIGIVTPTTVDVAMKKYVQDYNFLDPATTIDKYAQELKSQGVNAIVVLAHTGSAMDEQGQVVGESADILNKLYQIDPNHSVDLYVAGHSNDYTNGVIGTTRVVQTLSFGTSYDDVQAVYDFDRHDFVSTPSAQIVAVDPSQGVPIDQTVQDIVNRADSISNQIAGQPIGRLETGSLISRTSNSIGQSDLGTLITYAQYQTAKSNGMDVLAALTNNGGIRSDLIADSNGNITWGAAQAAQPFGNVVQIVQITGQDLKDALNQQTFASKVPGGSQFYLQAYGISYDVTDNPDTSDLAHPYLVANLKDLSGNPIEMTKSYLVAINEFIGGGGDGFTAFTKGKLVSGFSASDTDVLINYIKGLTANSKAIPTHFDTNKAYIKPSDLNDGNQPSPTLPSTGGQAPPETPAPEAQSTAPSDKQNLNHILPNTGDQGHLVGFILGFSLLLLILALTSWKVLKIRRQPR